MATERCNSLAAPDRHLCQHAEALGDTQGSQISYDQPLSSDRITKEFMALHEGIFRWIWTDDGSSGVLAAGNVRLNDLQPLLSDGQLSLQQQQPELRGVCTF